MREAEKVRVLLIIPAYNEEANIQRVIGRVREYRKTCPYQLDYVVINDGSTDSTARICRENGIHHISLLQNLGIGGAVQTGYLYAQREGYDIAVQFDGDGQHDLNSLPQLLAPVVRGDCDFCVGSRFLDKSSAFQSTPLRRVGIQYLSWLIRLFTGTKVTDPTSGFRAANQAVIRDLADYYPADYPEPESIVQIKKMRHRIQEVQVNMFQREGGQSSIRSWKSIYYMIKVSVAVVCASLQRGGRRNELDPAGRTDCAGPGGHCGGHPRGEPPGAAIEILPHLAADFPVLGGGGPVPENRLRGDSPGGH